MARFSLTFFSEDTQRGLWVNGPREQIPRGYWRRLTGPHAIRERLMRSRDGTTIDTTVPSAHSLGRFADIRYQAGAADLFKAGVSISTGLDGTPLDLIVSEPRTGTDKEYLFHCGGGRLEKVEEDGTVSQWGIDPPSTGPWGTEGSGIGEISDGVTVIDPQEKLIADTTTLAPAGSPTGWFGVPAPFLETNNVLSPSGIAVCTTIQPDSGPGDDEDQIDPDPGFPG